MARAHRHFTPGQAWHLTHRCHKREFLLKFVRDRQRWMHWLYMARRRFGLAVLNYCVARMSGYDEFPRFQTAHREWVEKALAEKKRRREAVWSESVAVGSRDYVAQVGAALGGMGCGRRIRKVAEGWELREAQAPYNADSEDQNGVIGHLNQRVWRINETITKI